MGTNYYLYLKRKYNPKYPGSVGCADGSLHDVQTLTNGYCWNNKYYATLNELNKEYYQVIHIGKNSFGWKFALCTYPAHMTKQYDYYRDDVRCLQVKKTYLLQMPIVNLDDWVELFNAKGNRIFDEYGHELYPQEMLNIINKVNATQELREQSGLYHKVIEGKNYTLVASGNDPEIGCVFC